MTHYLVTGGAGFIGSNIVEALLARGDEVRVLDDFSTGKHKNIARFMDRIDLIEGSLTDLDTVRRAVEGVEVVLHQGAIPSVPRSIDDPLSSNDANTNGTLHVLVASRDAGVRRVVSASSSSVYGDQAMGKAKVETMTPQPISPYAVSKLTGEYYSQVFYSAYGLETVCLRYFNVFGPRQDPNSAYAAVMPKFVTALLSGEPPVIYGDGEQTRDFTFIGNVVEGNIVAAEAPAEKAAGQVFNMATGGQISLNELVRKLQALTGSDIEPVYDPPRTGDIKHSRADIGKAKELLGYEPAYPFDEGLRRTVDWYRSHNGRG